MFTDYLIPDNSRVLTHDAAPSLPQRTVHPRITLPLTTATSLVGSLRGSVIATHGGEARLHGPSCAGPSRVPVTPGTLAVLALPTTPFAWAAFLLCVLRHAPERESLLDTVIASPPLLWRALAWADARPALPTEEKTEWAMDGWDVTPRDIRQRHVRCVTPYRPPVDLRTEVAFTEASRRILKMSDRAERVAAMSALILARNRLFVRGR